MTEPVIDEALVEHLIASQFPQWTHLAVTPVALSGWDNRTFHLGERMSVRLPSQRWYVPQVEKEQHWLPRLAPQLPLPISRPLALGKPDDRFPWPWSVYEWLPGSNAVIAELNSEVAFARDLASFLVVLYSLDASAGPEPGRHNFARGGNLSIYSDQTYAAIDYLGDQIDGMKAREIWAQALLSQWEHDPVWVHGDVSAGNVLIANGELAAVIDFGCCAVGDPACDLVICWTFLSEAGASAFRTRLTLDEGTWARGRGWALWKALIKLAQEMKEGTGDEATHQEVLARVFRDHDNVQASRTW